MVAVAFATASALLASTEYVCPVAGQTLLDAVYIRHISVRVVYEVPGTGITST